MERDVWLIPPWDTFKHICPQPEPPVMADQRVVELHIKQMGSWRGAICPNCGAEYRVPEGKRRRSNG
jgi:hypothetical protein